jgi:hypothetical protein
MKPLQAIGSHVNTVIANATNTSGAPVLIVAAAATDNVARTGTAVDLNTYGLPKSAVLSFKGLFTLGATETATLTMATQDSADNSTWNTAVTQYAAAVVGTGPTGGGNVECTAEANIDLSGFERYVRAVVTVDLSASSTDTGFYVAEFILGGQASLPV